jgi:hypothetical protein
MHFSDTNRQSLIERTPAVFQPRGGELKDPPSLLNLLLLLLLLLLLPLPLLLPLRLLFMAL